MNWLGKNLWIAFVLWGCAAVGNPGGATAENGEASFPVFTEGEKLTYRLLWPSGLSLGEAVLEASSSGEELRLQLTVEAVLPHYNISHFSSSIATREGLCSLRFEAETHEGAKKSEESIEFDQEAHLARRTLGNRTTSASIPRCARDPLAFLYYLRSQLAAGKTVSSGTFHFGANYDLKIRAEGLETVMASGRQWPSEKYNLTYTGPASGRTFELWVSTDSHRRPVRVRVPYPLAVFSAELE